MTASAASSNLSTSAPPAAPSAAAHKRAEFRALSPRQYLGADGQNHTYWPRLGDAFLHYNKEKDKHSIRVRLDSFPLDGHLVLVLEDHISDPLPFPENAKFRVQSPIETSVAGERKAKTYWHPIGRAYFSRTKGDRPVINAYLESIPRTAGLVLFLDRGKPSDEGKTGPGDNAAECTVGEDVGF